LDSQEINEIIILLDWYLTTKANHL
jgi:hypothetical protein